jgi:hypothetical protein
VVGLEGFMYLFSMLERSLRRDEVFRNEEAQKWYTTMGMM